MRNTFRVIDAMRSRETLVAARAYLKAGLKLILTHGIDDNGRCTCGNKDCSHAGKHPIAAFFPNGANSATSDIGLIRRTLRKQPHANIAATLEGRTVVDIDGPKGEAAAEALKLEKTVKVKTKRGFHLHYLGAPDGGAFKAEQVDVLTGANRYVMLPPSIHESGHRYRWLRSAITKAASVPDELANLRTLGAKRQPATASFNLSSAVTKGGRNNALASYAGYFRYKGLAGTALERILGTLNREICRPPLEEGEVSKIAHSIGNYEAGFENAFGSLADVEEEEVQYLAYPYVVKGATTVLDGNMGQGKSTFTAALAAAVTTGEPPPFLESIEQGDVLFLSAEDDPARVLKPRLVENGADISKVRYQEQVFSLDANGMMLLRQEIETHRPALVVIDPIIAYMDAGVDGNKANDTMRFMAELDLIAREYDVSILIVRHLRKAKADNAMHQGIGSIAVSARVRSGLILGIHPDDPSKRAIAHSKANYSEKGPTIVFELCSDEKGRPPVVKWHEADPHINEDDLLAKPPGTIGRPSEERDFAKEFLREALSKGPVEKNKLDQMASARSITSETLRRAADDMNITKVRGKKGRSVWSLP